MISDLSPDSQLFLFFRVLILISLILALLPIIWKIGKLRKRGIDPKGVTKEASLAEVIVTSFGSLLLVTTMVLYIINPQLIVEIPLFTPILIKLIGVIILFPGYIIYILSFRDIGDSFRIGVPQEGEKTELKTEGIYSYTRNPMVLAIFLFCLALLFLIGNFLACLNLVFNIIGFHLKVKWEEEFLEKRFGEGYLEYKKGVKRYIPKII
ncbi:MAG: methyltransferase family protein [Promethearchaeota archaeon]